MGRQGAVAMAAQQLQCCIPVVVPDSFALERINRCSLRTPTAKMLHGFNQGATVTAAHIPDHAIDIEEQNGLLTQGCLGWAGRFDV